MYGFELEKPCSLPSQHSTHCTSTSHFYRDVILMDTAPPPTELTIHPQTCSSLWVPISKGHLLLPRTQSEPSLSPAPVFQSQVQGPPTLNTSSVGTLVPGLAVIPSHKCLTCASDRPPTGARVLRPQPRAERAIPHVNLAPCCPWHEVPSGPLCSGPAHLPSLCTHSSKVIAEFCFSV